MLLFDEATNGNKETVSKGAAWGSDSYHRLGQGGFNKAPSSYMMDVAHQKSPVQSSSNPQHQTASHAKHGATTAVTTKQNGQPEVISADS